MNLVVYVWVCACEAEMRGLQRRSLAPSQVAKRGSDDRPVTSNRPNKRCCQEPSRKPLAQLPVVQQQPRTPEIISEHVSSNFHLFYWTPSCVFYRIYKNYLTSIQ
jgi:hypothetical protein